MKVKQLIEMLRTLPYDNEIFMDTYGEAVEVTGIQTDNKGNSFITFDRSL